jgi:hypothetical protein
VGKLPFFKALFAKAQTLRVFVRGHSRVLAAYRDGRRSCQAKGLTIPV